MGERTYEVHNRREAERGKTAAQDIIETCPNSDPEFYEDLIGKAETAKERNPAYWSAYITTLANRGR